MSEPMSVAFNAACHAMANRVLPLGFDVSGVDTDKPAPDTLEKLNACVETNRMIVDGANSSDTIFDDPETNYAFRAWHDWTHWYIDAPFTLAGETAVAIQQVEDIAKVYGDKVAQQFKPLIFAEVIGQALAYEITGQFPTDQVAFDKQFIAAMGRDTR